ncbi:MAG: response regulator transcription factor [Cyanobacteria bacterium P01_A01_bin.116]
MLNVLIVEDQQLIREGLVALLSLEADLTIWGEAENGQAALDLLAAKATQGSPDTGAPDVGAPDVALMDMRMPVMDGVAATERIVQQYPAIKVLVLTTFDDDELIAQSLAVGAKGYLLKDTPSEELAMAIRSVAKGYSHFGPGIVQKMMGTIQSNPSQSSPSQSNPSQSNPSQSSPVQPVAAEVPEAVAPSEYAEIEALTPREKEVLIHIGQGASNREIAKALHLSEGTIKNHVTRILSQLGLRDRTQAALLIHSHSQFDSQFGSQYRK